MAIDRIDWHWDSAEKLYRQQHNLSGALTEEQEHELWLLAGNHIGQFVRWFIERHLEGDDADEKDCQLVREGRMSGTEYLLNDCDGKLWASDVQEDVLPFVEFYYGDSYFSDYGDSCLNDTDKLCYSVLSDEADYRQLKEKIDRAYADFHRDDGSSPAQRGGKAPVAAVGERAEKSGISPLSTGFFTAFRGRLSRLFQRRKN